VRACVYVCACMSVRVCMCALVCAGVYMSNVKYLVSICFTNQI